MLQQKIQNDQYAFEYNDMRFHDKLEDDALRCSALLLHRKLIPGIIHAILL